MKVLLLGQAPSPLRSIIMEHATASIKETSAPLHMETLLANPPDFAISYGYRHIIKPPVIQALSGGLINLHISLLPWNRGTDPNFWSFFDDTPKGVTLHHIDADIDTGDLIAQRAVRMDAAAETLASSYARLVRTALELFAEQWPLILQDRATATAQPPGGAAHRKKDLEPHLHLLQEKGWGTPAINIFRAGAQWRGGL